MCMYILVNDDRFNWHYSMHRDFSNLEAPGITSAGYKELRVKRVL